MTIASYPRRNPTAVVAFVTAVTCRLRIRREIRSFLYSDFDASITAVVHVYGDTIVCCVAIHALSQLRQASIPVPPGLHPRPR